MVSREIKHLVLPIAAAAAAFAVAVSAGAFVAVMRAVPS